MENPLITLTHIQPVQPDALVYLNGVLPERDTLFLYAEEQARRVLRGLPSSVNESANESALFHVPLFPTIPPAFPLTSPPHISSSPQSVPTIAADGAAIKLRALGVMPDVVVGDLDSLRPELAWWRQQALAIIEMPDQNSTDFEKCLEFAKTQSWKNILVFGLHGGDFDHTLNNWSIVARYGQTQQSKLCLCVADAGKMAIPLYESVRIKVELGAMISLIPQPTVCLTTHGLEWELTEEVLALGTREGARNRARQTDIVLDIHEGALLLVVESVLPQMLAVVSADTVF